ncbi:MAG: GlsB/YeaQ/YmgE family stress response membrane protein [Chloroflexi bacterium]|nr:GlsB/YeaQ/YmgE family stress response membrane protein [Chloroflexota bacterium]
MLPVVIVVIAALLALLAIVHITTALLFLLIPWILLGLIAGWVASKIVGSPYGLGGDVLVGIGGSVIGGALLSLTLGVHTGGILSIPHILVSIVGSIILLLIVRVAGRPVLR